MKPLGELCSRTWQRDLEWEDYDYHTTGSPAPSWDVEDEEWEARDRRERHYDFIYLTPPERETDDWELAA